jgi:hypothetical protein
MISPYAKISVYHMCLVSAILSYSYVEIRDNHTGLGSAILLGQCVDISANHTGVQGRMAEPKPV